MLAVFNHSALKYLSLVLLFVLCAALSCESKDEQYIPEAKHGSIARFTVHEGYMYVLNPDEILTYTLSDPDKPQLVHSLPTDYGLETIVLYDKTIYVGSRTALYILDISNPAVPVLLSKTGRGSEFFEGCDPVVVRDNVAYSTIKIIVNICGTVNTQSALLVYDVTDKAHPTLEDSQVMGQPNGLGYVGNYLFVCDEGTDRLEAFDISSPFAPELAAQYSIALQDPFDLIVDGDRMIVATRTDFQVFDISALPTLRLIDVIEK